MTTYVGNPPKSVYGVKDATNVVFDVISDGTAYHYDIPVDFDNEQMYNVYITSALTTMPFLSLFHPSDLTRSNYRSTYNYLTGGTTEARGLDSDSYFSPADTGEILHTEATVKWAAGATTGYLTWLSRSQTWQAATMRVVEFTGQHFAGGAKPSNIRIADVNSTHALIPAGIRIQVTKVTATNLILPLEYSAPRQNILFNTDFAINQRGYVSGAALAIGTYGFDRWKSGGSANSTHTLVGGVVTIDNTTASTDGVIRQDLETGTLVVGKTYTLSWKGTAQVAVWYADGELGTLHGGNSYTFTATQTYELIYWQGDGVTVSEVKLEEGASVTPWEKPDIPTELARCQRYFERLDVQETAQAMASGLCQNATQGRFALLYSRKRAAPTIAMSTLSAFAVSSPGVDAAVTAIANANEGLESARILLTVASGLTTGRAALLTGTANEYIDIDAEM